MKSEPVKIGALAALEKKRQDLITRSQETRDYERNGIRVAVVTAEARSATFRLEIVESMIKEIKEMEA